MGEPTQADEFPISVRLSDLEWPRVDSMKPIRDAFDLDSLIAETTPSEGFAHGRSIARDLIEHWNTAAEAEYASQPKWRRVWWSAKRWWHGQGTTAEVAVCFLGLGYGLGLMTASVIVRWVG